MSEGYKEMVPRQDGVGAPRKQKVFQIRQKGSSTTRNQRPKKEIQKDVENIAGIPPQGRVNKNKSNSPETLDFSFSQQALTKRKLSFKNDNK